MKSFRHFVATALFFGKNAVRDNKEQFSQFGNRAFIVTDEFLDGCRNYALEDVTEALDELGIKYAITTVPRITLLLNPASRSHMKHAPSRPISSSVSAAALLSIRQKRSTISSHSLKTRIPTTFSSPVNRFILACIRSLPCHLSVSPPLPVQVRKSRAVRC